MSRFTAATLALCLVLGGTTTGCGETDAPRTDVVCPPTSAQPVVDLALLAFLSKAKAVHHQADLAEDGGKPAEALKVLEGLVDGPRPQGEPPSPEVREVLADTLGRTASLRSELEDYDGAKRDLARGLKLVPERNLFRGRLMEVTGVVEQRRHQALREAGDETAAAAAKERAIEAFNEAVAIQDEVITKTLEP